MQVQAKFKVYQANVTNKPDGSFDRVDVRMNAVYGPENEPWSKYTPSGQLNMSITNENLKDQFQVGQDYILAFDLED